MGKTGKVQTPGMLKQEAARGLDTGSFGTLQLTCSLERRSPLPVRPPGTQPELSEWFQLLELKVKWHRSQHFQQCCSA